MQHCDRKPQESPKSENGEREIDWGQPAQLFIKTTLTSGPDGEFSGPTKAEGSLSEVVASCRTLRNRHRARIVIAGGFHLDGGEIDRLAAKAP